MKIQIDIENVEQFCLYQEACNNCPSMFMLENTKYESGGMCGCENRFIINICYNCWLEALKKAEIKNETK